MNKKKQDYTIIEANEFYGGECINDSVSSLRQQERRPRGKVQIFKIGKSKKKELVYKDNIVVYGARETIIQRIFNLNNLNFAGGNTKPTKDCFLSWFGLGEGGVQAGDPLTPVAPVITDNCLTSPVPISDSTSSIYADFRYAGDTRFDGWTYSATGSYKKQFDTNGITFKRDQLNDNRYLIAKVNTTVDSDEANSYLISEAGLFTAESSLGGYTGPFILYARITFPGIVKSSEGRLLFSWYLYF